MIQYNGTGPDVTITNCPHCGQTHGLRCPDVKAIEYFEDGRIKRVEYLTPADRYYSSGAAGNPHHLSITVEPQFRSGAWGGHGS